MKNRRSTIRTTDGVELSLRWWVPDLPRRAVVLAHGFASSTNDPALGELAEALAGAGDLVVAFDSRGHGASTGECSLGDAERFDVAAAASEAAQLGLPVVIAGASMGAIASLRAVADGLAAPAGVVSVSSPSRWRPPLSPTGVGSMLLTRTPPGRALAQRLFRVRVGSAWSWPDPPLTLVSRIRIPTAVVHGRRDRFIGLRSASELHGAAAGPSRLWLVDGMGHAFCRVGHTAIAAAVDWAFGPDRRLSLAGA